MNEKPSPITQEQLERELAAMTDPDQTSTELWREALQQVRRERGTRPIPGRRRMLGAGVLAMMSLAIVASIGVWIGSTPAPDSTPQAAAVTPPAASSGIDIASALNRMLPVSAADSRDARLDRRLLERGGDEYGARFLSATRQAQIAPFDSDSARLQHARERRELQTRSEQADLGNLDDGAEKESLIHEPAPPATSAAIADLAAPAGEAATTPNKPAWRLLERRADIGIRVPDVAATAESVGAIADAEAGEFVSETNVQGEAHKARAAVALRVSASRYDDVIEEISRLGDVITIEAETEDLSLLADDLDARMISARKTEKDFDDLYHNYATSNTNDAAKLIQNEAAARSTVDRLMAERARLVDRAAWSTIRVLIVAEPAPRPPRVESAPKSKSYLSKLSASIGEGLHEAGVGLLAVSRALTIGLPFALVITGVAWLIWRRFTRR